MRWFQDAEGARRCVAAGLMIPNVSFVDRGHREFAGTEQERLRCFQQTGGFMMGDRPRCVSVKPFESAEPWVERDESEARRTESLAVGQCWRRNAASWVCSAGAWSNGTCCYGALADLHKQ